MIFVFPTRPISFNFKIGPRRDDPYQGGNEKLLERMELLAQQTSYYSLRSFFEPLLARRACLFISQRLMPLSRSSVGSCIKFGSTAKLLNMGDFIDKILIKEML